ncbi:MAG: hypothetical protein CMJ64_03425 [Planctomycetaceae bacterium]|nr:hypothetical protein [Planctomycetaceae bacterium]
MASQGKLNLLLKLVQGEPHLPTRQLCLQGVFRNRAAMSPLMEAGHYAAFRKLIEADDDHLRRAMMFGDFINGGGVLDQVVERDELFDYAKTEHEAARQQFLTRMFQNQHAITLILEKGRFDELLAIAKQKEGAFLDELIVVPKVIEHLTAQKQFVVLLDLVVKQGDDNARRQMLQRILYNQVTVKALIAADQFDKVFGMAVAERDANVRASLVGQVLSSTEVLGYFAKNDKLGTISELIPSEGDANARNRLLSYLTSRSTSVGVLIDNDQLGALYLSGDALKRIGQEERGGQLQHKANRLPLDSKTRHAMSVILQSRGLRNEAAEQWELLLKTAPLEAWELNDAARRLGDHLLARDPSRTADQWQQYSFDALHIAFPFLGDRSYLNMPRLIHKFRAVAAIRAEDWTTARREFDLALNAMPNDTAIVEELVPLLDAGGQRELGDAVVKKVVEHYRAVVEKYPNSASFHNNLAWAAARCHRQLDLALEHAKKAVELEPATGSYLDTLAEVHFHLGDRDQAVKLSERAVELRPTGSLQKRLNRFRNDPLPNP